ncbi:MAG TPA: T9SS type A sorting domain-containing protein [Ignavibacteria bacterium]|nr:T9SS type A sorting domain-containing protein [Ignavibacteria bacterium]
MKKHLLIVLALIITSTAVYSQAFRTVLLENWTSSTCGPCASNNPQLKNWIASNWNALVCVSYHVGWPSPGNDPMYLHNPVQSYDRRYYYGVNSVPQAYLQGLHTYVGSPFNFGNMQNLFNAYTSSTSNTGVTVLDQRIAGDSIKATVTVTNFAPITGNNYLRVMAVERWVVYTSPPGTNGETIFGNVFRKSFPTSQGTLISNNTGTEVFTFTYKRDPLWQDSTLYTMAFVQNDVDKTVLNSGRMGMLVGIEPYINETPSSFELKQNFPNPFNPTTNINFSLPKSTYVSLKVYDLVGREVKTLVDGNQQQGTYNIMYDAVNLPSGIYFYTLKTNEFTETKKMMLVK